MNAQEHYICAESRYKRSKDYTDRQAYEAATRELLAANYHATMALASAQIIEKR